MKEPERWLPRLSVVVIVLFTAFGLFQAPTLETDVDLGKRDGTFLFGFLFAFAILGVLTVRFVVLPRAKAYSVVRRDQIRYVGYSYAVAPASYGVIVPLFTGQGLLALPFAAVALLGLAAIWRYVAGESGTSGG